MRVLLIVVLLVFSISSFGQRKKIEEKYEFKDGKKTGRVLGLNFYGDTVNRIPVKFLSLKDLQAFREYEFDSIPDRCKWDNSYTVMLKINQKSKRIPYLKAQGQLPDNPDDAGVRISTYSIIFSSCAIVYTNMTLLGNEYSNRIASNVKIFDAFGKIIHEVTDTTETMFDHVEIDEDAKFMSCVTYTGPNEYGIIKGGTKQRSSTVSIYSLPDMKLVWKRKQLKWHVELVRFDYNYFYWNEKSPDFIDQSGFCVFDITKNICYRILLDDKQFYVDSIISDLNIESKDQGVLLFDIQSKRRIPKYFDRDFEKLK
ncbi:MAG: hypothetical protein JNK41_03130 [Saprospiraceae bacterium]|nr:hypothetical protein [Saprospiraceae bacterium]